MQLVAKELLSERLAQLSSRRQKLSSLPGLAVVWVGDNQATATFIRAKQAMAKKLNCQFFLHHFESVSQQQLEAVLNGLNDRKDIDGIVLQLPLPKSIDTDLVIAKITPIKDIDNLRGDSPYTSPTPSGIIALLQHHNIVIKDLKTVILGAGKLVGAPLAKMFMENHWPVTVIASRAEKQPENIRRHDLLIATTGVNHLVSPAMVHNQMIIIDGSGVDVAVNQIEPKVKAITPARGAIGPLTVNFLFENLLQATGRKARSTD